MVLHWREHGQGVLAERHFDSAVGLDLSFHDVEILARNSDVAVVERADVGDSQTGEAGEKEGPFGGLVRAIGQNESLQVLCGERGAVFGFVVGYEVGDAGEGNVAVLAAKRGVDDGVELLEIGASAVGLDALEEVLGETEEELVGDNGVERDVAVVESGEVLHKASVTRQAIKLLWE